MSPEVDPRRALPAVDRLLESDVAAEWASRWGRETVADALREAVETERRRLSGEGSRSAGGTADTDGDDGSSLEQRLRQRVLEEARRQLETAARPSLRPVLNGTGVVLHTNLGRAPLDPGAGRAVRRVAEGYSNLEYDLEEGARGSRYDHCVELLSGLTGAGSALVVNNNAAAVALAVHGLARGREVVVARGELVEIGGSFRLPEVVESAGGRLAEVGTTNRTRPADYGRAVGPETGMILKVHPSNYRVRGFTQEAELEDLVRLGERAGVPVVHDLGSGLLRPEMMEGYPPEPSPAASVEAGVDLATWSGDKLLGGPQAGILTGRRDALDALRDDPLLRALRVDKMTLAALEATLRRYRSGRGDELPALRALREPRRSVEERARGAVEAVEAPAGVRVTVEETTARVGGGAYPEHPVPSAGWRVDGVPPDEAAAACRSAEPPLVGRVADGAFWVDVRTLLPGQEEAAARVLSRALGAVTGDADDPARDAAGRGT